MNVIWSSRGNYYTGDVEVCCLQRVAAAVLVNDRTNYDGWSRLARISAGRERPVWKSGAAIKYSRLVSRRVRFVVAPLAGASLSYEWIRKRNRSKPKARTLPSSHRSSRARARRGSAISSILNVLARSTISN